MQGSNKRTVFFTSATNRYIAKAHVLAESVRQHYPDAQFVCMLSDRKDPSMDYTCFDQVLHIEDLEIPAGDLEFWLFLHSVVELCTAVKPFAFRKLFQNADRVIYLDPDIVVLSPMREVEELLEHHPIVLTPHVTVPGRTPADICDGEKDGCLCHGVFNLGFLALENRGQGADFLSWWAARCLEYCFDEVPTGLFTDQRWIDLAPCFFDDLAILRHPGYNVATWNLYYRDVKRSAEGYTANGHPLRFFHFSGFDIGTHKLMMQRHAPSNKDLHELTNWYIERQKYFGQAYAESTIGFYDRFADGTPIPKQLRVWFRKTPAVFSQYASPYQRSSLLRDFNATTNIGSWQRLSVRLRRRGARILRLIGT